MLFSKEELREYSDAYFSDGTSPLTDKEWDEAADKLGISEEGIGGAVNIKNRVRHEFIGYSLPKTHEEEELVRWAKGKACWMSEKLDGMTIFLTYDNGKISLIATRGKDGIEGEDLTHLREYIKGIPEYINSHSHIVIRGEALISYPTFNKLIENGLKAKNPRNLVAGTLNLDDRDEIAKRGVEFVAFKLLYHGDESVIKNEKDEEAGNSYGWRMNWLSANGFSCVHRRKIAECDQKSIHSAIEYFKARRQSNIFPTDGLVLCFDDHDYSMSGKSGEHHTERGGIAFKFEDETKNTVIERIEISASKTGLLNPVAVFKPVEIEGTLVSRATLHNFTRVKNLNLKAGDRVSIYKANMIIPELDKNFDRMNHSQITEEDFKLITCPVCGSSSIVNTSNGVITLFCPNELCLAKSIGKLSHFAKKDAMDIIGLSEGKVETLVNHGLIKEFADFFKLSQHREEIVNLEGFGEKSFLNMITAIEECRETDFVSFMHSLSIPNIGKGQSKILKNFLEDEAEKNNDDEYVNHIQILKKLIAEGYSFTQIEGFGEVLNDSLIKWGKTKLFGDTDVTRLLNEIKFTDSISKNKKKEDTVNSWINGKYFVITGKLSIPRKEFKTLIEEAGGKVTESVTSKTDILINNDTMSLSSKNKKAKELGKEILSEDEFRALSGI